MTMSAQSSVKAKGRLGGLKSGALEGRRVGAIVSTQVVRGDARTPASSTAAAGSDTTPSAPSAAPTPTAGTVQYSTVQYSAVQNSAVQYQVQGGGPQGQVQLQAGVER